MADDGLGRPRRTDREVWALLLRLPFRAGWRRPVLALALAVVGPATGVAVASALRSATDAIVAGDRAGATVAVVWFVVATGTFFAASFTSLVVLTSIMERTTLLLDTELAEMAVRAPGIEHYERPEHLDRLALLREQHQALAGGPTSLAAMAGAVLRILFSAALLATVSPVLAALPVFALPCVVAVRRSARRNSDGWDVAIGEYRLQSSLFAAGGSEPGGRELRVFGARAEMERRFAESIERGNAPLRAANARNAVTQTAAWALFGVAFAAGLVLVAERAVAGRATPGDVVLAVTLAGQLTAQLGIISQQAGALEEAVRVGVRYLWLAGYSRPSPGAVAPPTRLTTGIRFCGVGFRYPGTDREVLSDVDVHLPAGATVAIVGENGAGKTTLTKLLTRMYEPTVGSILVDGVDLATIDPTAWRACTSAAFQDHAHLELTAQHVVGLGSLVRLDDHGAVLEAIDDAAASDVLAALPDGLGTQLGRRFDDGVELSGGQWQKLAVARSMMRHDPVLLVLDEPTAALDARAEASLFERYTGAARSSASRTGAITLLVSHRFSTVRHADLILVVADRRIAEVGSHAQLMAAGGLYAELYTLQASAYG